MLSLKPLRVLLPLAATAAIALSGCGDDTEKAGSSLDEALGYLSEDAGFAFVASTEVDDYDQFLEIADKFPFSGRIQDALKEQLAQGDVNFDKDIKPLL